MPTEKSRASNEAEIRELIENRIKAVRAKDVDAVMLNYAPGVLSFDVVNPLIYVASDAVRKRLVEWFSSFREPIGHEIRDLSVNVGDDVAFSYGLNRVNATKIDGEKLDMWWRATVCYRKIDGKWMITHEHASVPFDVKTGKASLDLKP
jgi:ketosteroid isomerase-like protein